jgi:hypothetical protein
MSFTVRWTKEADSTFGDRIHYLNIHWTDREIKNFREREYLNILKDEPLLGKKAG